MAIVDLKANSEAEAGRNDVLSGKEIVVPFAFTTGAADSIGSVYRLACGVPAAAIVTEISIWTDGVTSMNDNDIGVYKNEALGGAVIDKDCFADAVDLSSAVLRSAPAKDGMVTVALTNFGKSIAGLLGTTLMPVPIPVDICMTLNAAATEADAVAGVIKFIAP